MTRYHWRTLGKIILNRFVICGGISGAVFLWAVFGASTFGVAISTGEQRSLVGGGGPDLSCRATDGCVICLAPAGCGLVTVFTPTPLGPIPWYSYCDCTVLGVTGCRNPFTHAICSPTPGGTCDQDGGPAACGSYATPDVVKGWVPPVGAIPGFWTCTPTCKPVTGASPYCNDCI